MDQETKKGLPLEDNKMTGERLPVVCVCVCVCVCGGLDGLRHTENPGAQPKIVVSKGNTRGH